MAVMLFCIFCHAQNLLLVVFSGEQFYHFFSGLPVFWISFLGIKERRNDLGISMPELGRRVGVTKSTIQRYETDGVDPKRTMIINGLAEALLTTHREFNR